MRLPRSLRRLLKPILPDWLIDARRRYRNTRANRRWDPYFAGKAPGEIFSAIYQKNIWGDAVSGDFYSGTGSHATEIVAAYVRSCRDLLSRFAAKPDVVDLGCGDFFVGSRLRDLCATYIACDVVPSLIEQNRRNYGGLNVDFRCLDITTQALPDGEIAFVRQVFDHLGNDHIAQVLPKLSKYRLIVVTASLPAATGFTPNLDQPTGAATRTSRGHPISGVVLTAPPFLLQPLCEEVICAVPEDGEIVRTTLYRLR